MVNAFFGTNRNKNTRHNLATAEQRDTWAYWFTESSWVGTEYLVSDITADDRYYFMGSKPEGDLARIHRVDLAPVDFSQVPNVTAINFSVPRLVNDGTTKISVTAAVSDFQGRETIDTPAPMHTSVSIRLSGGSTPTAFTAHQLPELTEHRAGEYCVGGQSHLRRGNRTVGHYLPQGGERA